MKIISLKKSFVSLSISISLVLLTSCGSPRKSAVFKKQQGKSTISIQQLNAVNGQIKALLELRSLREKSLESIDCLTKINESNDFNLSHNQARLLGPFAKETFVFQSDKINEAIVNSENSDKLNYSWNCEVRYLKGKEFIRFESVLFKVPGSEFEYR